MEPLNLQKYLKSEPQDCCVKGTPEFVTIIKQEKLTGDGSEPTDTLTGNNKLKKECIISLDRAFGIVKTETMENDEILNHCVTAGDMDPVNTDITVEEINTNEQCLIDSNLIKIEEIYIENEDNKDSRLMDQSSSMDVDKMQQFETFKFEDQSADNIYRMEHKKREDDKLLFCYHCGYQTTHKGNLISHLLQHRNPEELDRYTCDHCGYKTLYKSNLNGHIRRHNKTEIAPCHTSEKQAKLKGDLKKPSRRHNTIGEGEMYRCEQCPYETLSKSTLRNHRLRHNRVDLRVKEMYTCDKCSYQSASNYRFKNHMSRRHGSSENSELLKCEYYEYQPVLKSSHNNHEELHMQKCSECSYETYSKDHMKSHCFTHRKYKGVKMHKCKECSYSCTTKSSLTRHSLRHKQPGEIVKMHKCDRCLYEAYYKSDLKKHYLRHMPREELVMHQCSECSYETSYKSHLNKHFLIHKKPEEVEMYKCDVCGYETLSNHNLKRHVLRHQKPDQSESVKTLRLWRKGTSQLFSTD